MWASVSVLWTNVGRRRMRSGTLLSGRNTGSCLPVSIHCANADSSPPTNRDGGRTRYSRTGAHRYVARSYRARPNPSAMASLPCGMHTRISLRAARSGQHLGSVEDQVGSPGQKDLVLVAGRLALHAVHDEDAPPAIGRGGGEFRPGREGPPASPGQSGGLQGADQRVLPFEVASVPVPDRGWRGVRPGRPDGRADCTGRGRGSAGLASGGLH